MELKNKMDIEERASGLVKITDMRKFRKAIKGMKKDLIVEGFDKDDVRDIIINWASGFAR